MCSLFVHTEYFLRKLNEQMHYFDVRTVHFVQYLRNIINPLNAKLNSICPVLALLGAHHILHVSRVRVNIYVVR